MTGSDHSRHHQAIVDQFSRQAVPFARKMEQAQQEALELMLQISGVTAKDQVLDVACGPGLVACAFAARARHVTGIDLTPAMIEQARRRQQKLGLTNLDWVRGDVLPLPYGDAAFSLVITRFSFHHFLNPKAVFAEMVRVCLPKGGVMVVDVALPADKREAFNRMEKLRDPSHTRTLTPAEMMDMAHGLGLKNIKTHSYYLALEMEQQLQASFPNPGDEEKIRKMLREDVGQDHLGVGAHRQGDEIHLAYPIMILMGRKGP